MFYEDYSSQSATKMHVNNQLVYDKYLSPLPQHLSLDTY